MVTTLVSEPVPVRFFRHATEETVVRWGYKREYMPLTLPLLVLKKSHWKSSELKMVCLLYYLLITMFNLVVAVDGMLELLDTLFL